jgi:large subunit ribosomal protein L32e
MTERKATSTQNALKVRARAKKSKPAFVRAESWRFDRFSESWRRPRGLDNKIRRKIKGWPPGPSAGYMGPKVARGLHPSGYEEVLVHNVNEVTKIVPETQAVRIAHTVGQKKRMQIIAEAKKLNLFILNFKEAKVPAKEEAEEETKAAEAKKKAPEKKKAKKIEKPKKKEQKKPKKGAD